MEQTRTKLTFKQLRYYAHMAAEAYAADPVHMYATKHASWRKRYDYHFMLARLMTSNREDIIYTDEEHRGICIWRDAHNAYTIFDFWLVSLSWSNFGFSFSNDFRYINSTLKQK